MIADAALRLVVTAMFAVSALYCAVRLTRRISVPARGTYAAHLLMGAAMIVMAWPAGMGVLAVPQLIVFGAATVWFLVLAISFGRAWARSSHHERHGRLVYWYHAVMMAAMVWMLAAMARAGVSGSGSAGHHAAAMPGMVMGGGHAPIPVTVAAWSFGLLFSVAALVWLGQLVPEGAAGTEGRALRLGIGPEVGYETLMAVGMAIMSFAFL